jgi:hypothetical protein
MQVHTARTRHSLPWSTRRDQRERNVEDPPNIDLSRNEALDLTALLLDVEEVLMHSEWLTLALDVTEWREHLEDRLWPE